MYIILQRRPLRVLFDNVSNKTVLVQIDWSQTCGAAVELIKKVIKNLRLILRFQVWSHSKYYS